MTTNQTNTPVVKNAAYYKLTSRACYLGIFSQAISCNILAILFIPMMELYNLNYIDLGILVAVNFTAQIAVDIIFSGIIDRVGYKKVAIPAVGFAVLGLSLLALAPVLFPNHVFVGIIIATIVFAASSGLLEVLISPIANAIPSQHKGASMSFMHSFYAWGQVATIAGTTLFVFLFGGKNWQIIALLWALVPLITLVMILRAPFPETYPDHVKGNVAKVVLKPFFIIALFAILFGASSELVMAQWASTFLERGLELPKVLGDMLGMCGFAIMMGCGRLFHGIFGARFNLSNVLIMGSLLAAVCYIVAALSPSNSLNLLACAACGFMVSQLWPGTVVVAAERFPMAGAWMFALLSAAGDIGAGLGPYVTGIVVDTTGSSSLVNAISQLLSTTPEQATIRLGMLTGAIFPLLCMICHILLKKLRHSQK